MRRSRAVAARATITMRSVSTIGRGGMEPKVSYARAADGVSIAFIDGGRGPALVWLPPVPFKNVVGNWRIPRLRTAMELLERNVRLVQYDGRGTGHSQREVTEVTDWEAARSAFSPIERVLGGLVGIDPFVRLRSVGPR